MDDLRILVGDRLVPLPEEMVRELNRGGRLVPLPSEGAILCIPIEVRRIVEDSISRALSSFTELQTVPSERIDSFFEKFAELIDDDETPRGQILAQAADGGEGQDVGHAHSLQGVDVRAIIQMRRRDRVSPPMPRQEHDFSRADASRTQDVRCLAPRA